MSDFLRLFDPYSRQARLYPALLTLLPALAMSVAWFPTVTSSGQILLELAAACGLLFLLADLARARGKRIEPILLRDWGGWPTTLWLRHADSHLSPDLKRRYHAFLSKQPSLGAMPTIEQERADSPLADERYASAVSWLKEKCRGTAFPLVEKENAAYGFRRNLLGLKTFGIILSTLTFAFPAVALVAKGSVDLQHSPDHMARAYLELPSLVLSALALALVVLAAWIFVVRRDWVRAAGDQYARALLANCDSLDG
jgi:hypothetical protein